MGMFPTGATPMIRTPQNLLETFGAGPSLPPMLGAMLSGILKPNASSVAPGQQPTTITVAPAMMPIGLDGAPIPGAIPLPPRQQVSKVGSGTNDPSDRDRELHRRKRGKDFGTKHQERYYCDIYGCNKSYSRHRDVRRHKARAVIIFIFFIVRITSKFIIIFKF